MPRTIAGACAGVYAFVPAVWWTTASLMRRGRQCARAERHVLDVHRDEAGRRSRRKHERGERGDNGLPHGGDTQTVTDPGFANKVGHPLANTILTTMRRLLPLVFLVALA